MSKIIAVNALIGIGNIMEREIAKNDFFTAKKRIQQSIYMLKAAYLTLGGFSNSTLESAIRIINDPKIEVNLAIGADATEAVRPPESRYWDAFSIIDVTFNDWVNMVMDAENMEKRIDVFWDAIWWFIDINVVDVNEFKYWRQRVLELAEIVFIKGYVWAESCY